MQRSSYRERDYAFGQAMLRLRTSIGLTQAGLAEVLGISRKAASRWEVGDTYPAAEHLKAIIELAWRASAFTAGREDEEIRALWKAAHQKMFLDEAWLAGLLSDRQAPPTAPQAFAAPSGAGPHVDWGDALAITSFYGRAWEQDLLAAWVAEERCRVVSVLGQGASASRHWQPR